MSAIVESRRNAFEEVNINGVIWANKNYDFGGSYPDGSFDNITDYGNLYTWAEAMAINFPGWRLPTVTELNDLQNFVGIDGGGHLKEAGTTYWNSPNTDADDSTNFGARGSGYDLNPTQFKNLAYFWSSTETGDPPVNAYYLNLFYNSNVCGVSNTDKDIRMSVRLVKDV